MLNARPATVSPGAGNRGALITKSAFRLPMTTMPNTPSVPSADSLDSRGPDHFVPGERVPQRQPFAGLVNLKHDFWLRTGRINVVDAIVPQTLFQPIELALSEERLCPVIDGVHLAG